MGMSSKDEVDLRTCLCKFAILSNADMGERDEEIDFSLQPGRCIDGARDRWVPKIGARSLSCHLGGHHWDHDADNANALATHPDLNRRRKRSRPISAFQIGTNERMLMTGEFRLEGAFEDVRFSIPDRSGIASGRS